ncbi:hypothetical protein TCAL_01486 [Tigriopus californicus]|uniref:DnaJ homolog subfamily C member 22 n=1 Tax=Tigriopus californicus TaxID=6832 RepID=A0A553N904_TIGCA|nr:dnaJ homolog subfamily C member 22-like [Tigriopus californicus]TRY61895.1 hypothetical protein TCAL_01486 [Tigriopus californicus]
MKSYCLAYFFWLFGGFLGAHHLYLRRYKQAFVWWCLPGGYFGAGWFRDVWRIPEYVREANNDAEYLKDLSEIMRKYPRPPISFVRILGQLLFGNILSVVLHLGIPNKEDFGLDLEFLPMILAPAATALGIWVVGNIGRQQGSLLPPILACYSVHLLRFMGFSSNAWICLAGIVAFQWKSRQWSRKIKEPEPFWRTTLILVICALMYSSLWTSYVYYNMRVVTKEGDEIPVRDAIGNFLKSPAVQEFWRNLGALWNHAWAHGFISTFQQLIDSLDPLGEKNALKMLDLKQGASQEEIRTKYRELSKRWHPDKVTNEAEKDHAQAKFLEIQQAYERLSDIKSRRSRRNKLSA